MLNLFKEFVFNFSIKYIKTIFLFFSSLIGLMKWSDFFSRWELVRISSRLKIFQTVYINLRMLPFKQAIKIPIVVYGKTTFISLKGKVVITGKLEYGVLKIGIVDPIRSLDSVNLIDIDGILYIDSANVLRQGIKIRISKKAKVILNKNVYIGDNNTIISDDAIIIGANTRVGNNTTFMDTDFHYLINVNTREVKNNKGNVIIGENNWIGAWCTVKKGTKTPKGTIIAGPYSMVSKDYTKLIKENSVIGGAPSKLIVEGFMRISSYKSEIEIAKHYKTNSEIYIVDRDIDMECFCVPKYKNE
jgi:acetyltransferase-like isoleucine patch superfamily enzyme